MQVSIPDVTESNKLPKRKMVSSIAKTYDIMGWFAPVILYAKILLQQVWESNTDWVEAVPVQILKCWNKWSEQLPSLSQKPLPHCYTHITKEVAATQLHGFADASERGYGAVVYIRSLYTDASVSVSLVDAKTKVAPLNMLTIPMLD